MSKINAAVYYRMSTDRQETSIADQRTAVEEYAAANGYKIVREYLDEGISGTKTEQRKGFQRLIEDVTGGDFQAILLWDQDRLSRFEPMEANYYWFQISRAGVHIATVAQGRLNFEDLGGWLQASVVQHGKAAFIKDLARNTARGMRKLKLEGRWLTCAPIGYRVHDKRLVAGDNSAVAIVRKIFGLRAQGYGCRAIAKKLNDAGIPTVRKHDWRANGIRQILRNPAYIGHTVVGGNARGKYARVLDGIVKIENTHPPIIDPATWAAVEQLWKCERKAHGRRGEGAPLAGLLRCGRCGKPMYAARGTKYTCSSYHAHRECGYCNVNREPLLAAVAAKIRQYVLMGSPARLEAAIQRQLDRRKQHEPNNTATVRQVATLDRQIARAADRMLTVDDSLVEDIEQSLLALKRQRDQLAATINVNAKPKRLPTAKERAAKMWELDRILREAPATHVRHALSQLIDHIRLDFEPAKTNLTGRSYRFVGGAICMRTQAVQQGSTI